MPQGKKIQPTGVSGDCFWAFCHTFRCQTRRSANFFSLLNELDLSMRALGGAAGGSEATTAREMMDLVQQDTGCATRISASRVYGVITLLQHAGDHTSWSAARARLQWPQGPSQAARGSPRAPPVSLSPNAGSRTVAQAALEIAALRLYVYFGGCQQTLLRQDCPQGVCSPMNAVPPSHHVCNAGRLGNATHRAVSL